MYNNGFRDRKRAFTGMKTVEHIADKNVKIEGYEYYRYTTTVDLADKLNVNLEKLNEICEENQIGKKFTYLVGTECLGLEYSRPIMLGSSVDYSKGKLAKDHTKIASDVYVLTFNQYLKLKKLV